MMKATDVVARAQDVLTVQRVFGAPIERNGLTVIPVARFAAGGGAGNGEGPDGADGQARGSGSGGGYGLKAGPAGVFVIGNGAVRWRPAIDVNRVVLGGQLVAITALLTVRLLVKLRARRMAVTAPAGSEPSGHLPAGVSAASDQKEESDG